MMRRRDFLNLLPVLGLWPAGCARFPQMPEPLGTGPDGLVNDVHSKLNPTRVNRVLPVDSVDALRTAFDAAHTENRNICIAGTRHAMGAQQFCTDGLMLDMTPLNRVLEFDSESGLIDVEAGIQWPELYDYLHMTQADVEQPWVVAQKQTGAARLTLGGALAANVHGRALKRKPIIADVESFTLLDAGGRELNCSRSENSQLFRLAIGGYGLFGVIASLRLRLVRRQKLERVVDILNVEDAMPAFEERIADGFIYGDFQYAIDENSPDFLRKGILACYRAVDIDTPIPRRQRGFTLRQWSRLVYYAHTAKSRAFEVYAQGYQRTSGQIYWSDSAQLGSYVPDYHLVVDRRMNASYPATEMITEIDVPRSRLADFMGEVREDFQSNGVQVIYGTIRMIAQDDECFLAWAKQPYACIVFNLHIEHTPEAIEHAAGAFRRLIDMAIARGGSYYLTYHKYATPEQVLACYPQFPEFLRLKRQYDPGERFQSNWYRHYRDLFAEAINIPQATGQTASRPD